MSYCGLFLFVSNVQVKELVNLRKWGMIAVGGAIAATVALIVGRGRRPSLVIR